MGYRGIALLCGALAISGCAANLTGTPAKRARSLNVLTSGSAATFVGAPARQAAQPPVEPAGAYSTAADGDFYSPMAEADPTMTLAASRQESTPEEPAHETIPEEQSAASLVEFQTSDIAEERWQTSEELPLTDPTGQTVERVNTPAPAAPSPFKLPLEDESKIDRFTRQIVDVPVDIRPTEGLMPEDIGAEKFAAEPTINETLPSGEPADIFCSYTPWTICYRPLYFEDIGLERYGKNVGYLQTGLSGVRFFGSVAALPYKMTRRRPRSCECSNGFSRPGDCPLPGYGNRRFEWDAALVEAAMVTAVVYFIP